jgi:hypothetical protein
MEGWQRNIWTEDRGRDGRLAEKTAYSRTS